MRSRPIAILALLLVPTAAQAEVKPFAQISAGMTITQVQALIGPPSAVKSLREREVMFYCPRSFFGFMVGDPVYSRVYLVHRRVVASETLMAPSLGTCEEFLAAFQWTDPLPYPFGAQFK